MLQGFVFLFFRLFSSEVWHSEEWAVSDTPIHTIGGVNKSLWILTCRERCLFTTYAGYAWQLYQSILQSPHCPSCSYCGRLCTIQLNACDRTGSFPWFFQHQIQRHAVVPLEYKELSPAWEKNEKIWEKLVFLLQEVGDLRKSPKRRKTQLRSNFPKRMPILLKG